MRLQATNVGDPILGEERAFGQGDLRTRLYRRRGCLNEERKKSESSGELDLHIGGGVCARRSWASRERFPVQLIVELDKLLYPRTLEISC